MKVLAYFSKKDYRWRLSLLLTAAMVLILIAIFGTAAFADGLTPPDGSVNDCLTFSSTNGFSISTTKGWDGTIWYSTDNNCWTEWNGSKIDAAQKGSSGDYVLYFAGKNNSSITAYDDSTKAFVPWSIQPDTADGKVAVGGNIMTLVDYITPSEGKIFRQMFYCMFKDCTCLETASENLLPATTLVFECYRSMFYNCTNLKTAPKLSATMLARGCYRYMFYNCTSLETAPKLPATELKEECYRGMFGNCKGLKTAPELPATELKEVCYYAMFSGCKGLKTAPELPAMTMKTDCYVMMFYNCTGLEEPPKLPATTLAKSCYQCMFGVCKGLKTAPELPATTLAKECYRSMFENCTGLKTAPELSATTLASDCYRQMFKGCKSLESAPKLPATELADYCYHGMFYGCTSFESAPELPATELVLSCYSYMFTGCIGLNAAPELPAKILAEDCYRSMFEGCTGLRIYKNSSDTHSRTYRIPNEGTGTDTTNALTDMFTGTGGDNIGTPVINTIYYLTTQLTVTYNANGGSGKTKELAYNSDESILQAMVTIQPNEFIKSGCRFIGWNTASDSRSGISYQPGELVNITENMNLYAQWEDMNSDITYMLSYETNGGTVYSPETYLEGTVVSLTKAPERKGATFDGWYADKALTEKITEIKMTCNHTVYAGWKVKESSIDESGKTEPSEEKSEKTESEFLLNTEHHDAYMNGDTDGMFYPERSVTRAETAAMLFRLLKPEVIEQYRKTDCDFADVEKNGWYITYVATLSNAGIIEGYENNTFRPFRTITRAEFATMIDRFFIEEEDEAEYTNKFSDVSESYWAGGAITRCIGRTLLKGYEDGTFRPEQSITRAEATAIMNRVLQRNPTSAEALLPEMIQWPDNQDTELWYYIDVQEASNSHEYVRNEDGTETWTALKSVYDWKQYE